MATNNSYAKFTITYRKGTATVIGDHFEIWITQLHLASHLTAINNVDVIISGDSQQVLNEVYPKVDIKLRTVP